MTPRERVTKALNHQIADRVPIDFGGFQTGIHKKAYAELLTYLGITENIKILDPVQQLAEPSEEILKRFNVDIRYIFSRRLDKVEKNTRNGKLWHDLKDEFGVTWSVPDGSQLYMGISHHPLADAVVSDIVDYPFPVGGDPASGKGGKWVGLDSAFKSSKLGGYDAGHIALAVGNGEPAGFLSLVTTLGRFKIDRVVVKKGK